MKIGDKLSDNDPRMKPRIIVITSMDETHVIANGRYRIMKKRIHSDGKTRNSGFTLIIT